MIENFNPTTPTEMALWNEINRLRVEKHILEREKGIFPYSQPKAEDIPLTDLSPEIRLRRTADIRVHLDPTGVFKVVGRCRSKEGELGFAYYIDESAAQTKFQAADLLMELHKKHIHMIADEITGQKR